MAVEVTYPHIEIPPGDSPRLKNHPRTRVSMIVTDYLARGWSVDEICRQYPHLHQAEVHSAMAYYFDHKEEIDEEIRRELEEYERTQASAPPSPFLLKMRAKGMR